MQHVLIPALAASLVLTACSGSNIAGGAPTRIDPLPTEAALPCLRPSDALGAGDWEIITGRLGDGLITCEQRRSLAVEAYEGLRRALAR